MASLSNDPGGRRRVLFVGPDGRRKQIRLGVMPKKAAETVRLNVEGLVACAVAHVPWDNELAGWVRDIGDTLADKLANVGLIPRRARATLAGFLDEYVSGRADLKRRTHMKLATTRQYLVDHFGAERALRDITPGDADGWRLFLLGKGHAENTARKHISIAKQFLTAAVRRRLISSNPFADLRSTVQARPERFYFVSVEEAEAVLNACPDAEWRLIVALARYGGLRCPSELLAMRWDDVRWAENKVTIHSPKTEHHEGGASRVIPLFLELRPYLEDAHELAPDGAEFVIGRYRDGNQNLRTQLERIIRRAGLKPWPKLFQNLRSSRQTELERKHPSHVVCAWIGNSLRVAAKHYLQVTDADFERATQKAAQYPPFSVRMEPDGKEQTKKKAVPSVLVRMCTAVQIAEEGLEPPTRGL